MLFERICIMMSNENVNYKDLKKEINSLKTKLKEINNDKESWFKKKEELKKEMGVLIEKIKAMQKERDEHDVDKLKKERDSYNAQVKELIVRINELRKEKRDLLEKHGIKEDPEQIKKVIEKIEERIETEALSIDREKRLMEQIKRMKRNYEALGGVKLIDNKIKEISGNIEETKRKANDAHEKLKKALKDKKKWYGEFFSLSKQINVIKKQQEKAFEMFISFKNSFIDVSKQLSSKLSLFRREKEKIEENIKLNEEKIEEKKNRVVEEKRKKVEEKLKKGEKLTTEDLIAMQDKDESETIK